MQSDAVVDPFAVMIEFIGTPVALPAVFGVLENVGRTYLTPKVIVSLVEIQFGHFILFCLPCQSIKSHGGVSRITRCNF